MPTINFSAEYDTLMAISNILEMYSSEVYDIGNGIARKADDLQAGGWLGKAAERFYGELDGEVYPVLKSLSDDMLRTSDSLRSFIQLLLGTDDAMATLFGGTGGAGGSSSASPESVSVPSGSGEQGFSWTNLGKEVLLGDFNDGPSSWAGVAANIGVGLIPGVGQIADARDTLAAIKGVWNEPGSGGAWATLGLAALGWVPIAGDAIKGAGKVGKQALKHADDLGDAAKIAKRATVAGKMENIHNAAYKKARQEFLERLANDPNQPKHIRGWVKQELNRLDKPSRASDWLSKTNDSTEEIMRKRAQRAEYSKRRPSKYIDYESDDIRMIPGYDVGHKNNQLPIDQVNDPSNFQIENSGMNRSKGARSKR